MDFQKHVGPGTASRAVAHWCLVSFEPESELCTQLCCHCSHQGCRFSMRCQEEHLHEVLKQKKSHKPTQMLTDPSLSLALQGGMASPQPQDSQNLLTVRKISVSRMHSLPNDSYMFRPVMPAKAPFPLHEVEMETYPCKSQRGTIRVAPAKAMGQMHGGWMGKMPPELHMGWVLLWLS